MFNKIVDYFKGVRTEVKKVSWPKRDVIFKYTVMVIGASLSVAVFLGGLDWLFGKITEKIILHF